MKKLIILVSAVALSGTMFAQKGTTDNPWTLEGTFNYTSGSGFRNSFNHWISVIWKPETSFYLAHMNHGM